MSFYDPLNVLYIILIYLPLELYLPLVEILKGIIKKDYYKPYSILADKSITGIIKRFYTKKYYDKIYEQALSTNFEWLKIDKTVLDEFFQSYKISDLGEKLTILETCNREQGYKYDVGIIFYQSEPVLAVANELIMLNEER